MQFLRNKKIATSQVNEICGAIYNNQKLMPFKELDLDSQRAKNLLPSFMCILSSTLPNLSIPNANFPVQLSTLIGRWFQFRPATLLIPIRFSFFFVVEESQGTRSKLVPFP
jgi:hypothetical protein